MPPPAAADSRDFINETARQLEPDRAIAAVLSPARVRDDLLTLAAYLGEIGRVPLTVRDLALAEIRLQWWRDALTAGAQGGLTGNPIADEMVRVIARHGIALDLVMSPLEAASWELGVSSASGLGPKSEWLATLDRAETAGMVMSASILNPADAGAELPALELAGQAYGRCRLALRIPALVARGRWPLPDVMTPMLEVSESELRVIVKLDGEALIGDAVHGLGLVRDACNSTPMTIFPAILPASLIPAYAKVVLRGSRDVLREPAQIAPLTRFMRLWWAATTGRI